MELLEEFYTDNYKDFNQWFTLLKMNTNVYPRYRVPYSEWVDEYINEINNKSEDEVKELIRYLLAPFTREADMMNYEYFDVLPKVINNKDLPKDMIEGYQKMAEGFIHIEKYRRIERGQDAWEGLTWILQMLPFRPYKAIKALNSYLDAEIMYMPDDRIIGIEQCISIIEAKFIYTNVGLEKHILNLSPREFELLIGSLYRHLGYEVEVTKATRDGGKDIIARIKREDGNEIVYAECKLYKTSELTPEKVNALFGVICIDNINRGVIFCTGYVSNKLKKANPRIQIWTLENIITLLNAHLGSDWSKRLNILINN
ncbi:restriction endonuclease [Clostridium paraputrificum]|uniref:restriction endonuclease n=1 Tax=Clostridium paraputrificum TaxID=29363 RepID=UPI001897C564|nr:restriction endonuclease [Clostridium paraputrificum]MDB2123707.1 restriction endonuclease [Clostridium paraputrificum]